MLKRDAGSRGKKSIDIRRIARTISIVENQAEGCEAILARAYRVPRWADVIGITGPPGVGKSTLVDAVTAHWAEAGDLIAILAIDPSSPFSGGAVLGDRIRRTRSMDYSNTYFRSISSRGHVGGLSETTTDLVAVLSLFGFTRVVVETVGAGQSDVEIHETADCTVAVTAPGLGDGVQASKAGLMEIGDVFVVNKADTPGAEGAARDVRQALGAAYRGRPGINERSEADAVAGAKAHSVSPGAAALRRRHGDLAVDASAWVPPVIQVVAADNTGIRPLATAIDTFVTWSEQNGRRSQRGRERARAQIVRALTTRLLAPFLSAAGTSEWPASIAAWADRVVEGKASPTEAAQFLLGSGGPAASSVEKSDG
jgi:LAO/AO transport system kinase